MHIFNEHIFADYEIRNLRDIIDKPARSLLVFGKWFKKFFDELKFLHKKRPPLD